MAQKLRLLGQNSGLNRTCNSEAQVVEIPVFPRKISYRQDRSKDSSGPAQEKYSDFLIDRYCRTRYPCMHKPAYAESRNKRYEANKMTVPKIVVAANLQPDCDFIDPLRNLAFHQKIILTTLPANTPVILPDHLDGANAIILKPTATRLNESSLSKAKQPFAIGTVSAGVEHLSFLQGNHNVSIFNSPGGNYNGTSDLTLSLAKELIRPIRRGAQDMASGIFDPSPFTHSSTLRDKRWLIVGSGHIPASLIHRLSVEGLSKITVINRQVDNVKQKIDQLFKLFPQSSKPDLDEIARTGQTFMETTNARKTQFQFLQMDFSDISQLVSAVSDEDVVSINLGVNPSQRPLFNKDIFCSMRKSPILVNAGRASLIEGCDVVNALERKQISGYGTDVINTAAELHHSIDRDPVWTRFHEDRNKSEQDRLNIMITPHIGGATYEDQKLSFEVVINKILGFLGLQKTI